MTGFDWIFYLYGPWSEEYDSLLEDLERRDLIRIDQWSKGDLAGARLEANESRDLNKLIESTDEYYRVQHQVAAWANKALPDLLNYVYFSTDPIRDAVSFQKLNFDQIDKVPPPIYQLQLWRPLEVDQKLHTAKNFQITTAPADAFKRALPYTFPPLKNNEEFMALKAKQRPSCVAPSHRIRVCLLLGNQREISRSSDIFAWSRPSSALLTRLATVRCPKNSEIGFDNWNTLNSRFSLQVARFHSIAF